MVFKVSTSLLLDQHCRPGCHYHWCALRDYHGIIFAWNSSLDIYARSWPHSFNLCLYAEQEIGVAARREGEVFGVGICQGTPILSFHPNATTVNQTNLSFVHGGEYTCLRRIDPSLWYEESRCCKLRVIVLTSFDKCHGRLTAVFLDLSLGSYSSLPL